MPFPLLLLSALSAAGEAPEIRSVTVSADKRAVVVAYSLGGRTLERRAELPKAEAARIGAVTHCPWMDRTGVAVAVTVGTGRDTRVRYATLRLGAADEPARPLAAVPAPAGEGVLAGIANTEGDSVVVTFLRHRRAGGVDRLDGWMFVDNCPVGFGTVIPFEASGKGLAPGAAGE